jgi:hypothetical protein
MSQGWLRGSAGSEWDEIMCGHSGRKAGDSCFVAFETTVEATSIASTEGTC